MTPRLIDRLRAIPSPIVLPPIAGTSYIAVPAIATVLFGSATIGAQAGLSNERGRARSSGIGLPATMPTSMPNLTGSTPTATYAAPATVSSTSYAAGGGDGTSSGGAGGGGAGGSSNARHHQPKAADQARTAPADHPRAHLVPRGLGDPHSNRHATAAATGSVYHHDLPPPVRPVMPMHARTGPAPFRLRLSRRANAVRRRLPVIWWLPSPLQERKTHRAHPDCLSRAQTARSLVERNQRH